MDLGEGNMVLGNDLGDALVDALEGEWRLLYTSSNAMEYNQARNSIILFLEIQLDVHDGQPLRRSPDLSILVW